MSAEKNLRNQTVGFVLASVGFCLLAFIVWGVFVEHTITRSQVQVNELISKQLPKQFPVKKGGISVLVNIENAEVEFKAGKVEVAFSTVMQRNIEGFDRTKLRITASALGTPEFDAGKFFFKVDEDDIKIEDLSLVLSDHSSRIGGYFKGKASELINKDPKLADLVDATKSKVKEKVKEKLEEQAAARVAIALAKFPVYTLKDDMKGFAIGASLRKIEILEGEIKITFSLALLTMKIIGGVIITCLIIMLAIGMARSGVVPFFFFDF